MTRTTEFRPTYKSKQKFKKFFFPRFFRFSPVLNSFSPSSFSTQLPVILRSRNFLLQRVSFSRYFKRLFTRKSRTIFKVVLVSKSFFFINQITMVAIKRLLSPFVRGQQLKKITQIFFPNFSTFNFTKKPLAVRMGGGVGKKIRKTGFFVCPGSSLIVVYTKKPSPIRRRLEQLQKKFSGSTYVSVS